MRLTRARRALVTASATLFVTLATAPAFAAGTNKPWEQPLTQILDSVQGPVARVISVTISVITGLTLAFDETSGGFRRLMQIVDGQILHASCIAAAAMRGFVAATWAYGVSRSLSRDNLSLTAEFGVYNPDPRTGLPSGFVFHQRPDRASCPPRQTSHSTSTEIATEPPSCVRPDRPDRPPAR